MQAKCKQILSIILIVFMFVSGMCYEDIQADSLSDCTSVDPTMLYIPALDAEICSNEICTTEMLGVRNISYNNSTVCRTGCKIDIRGVLACLWEGIGTHIFSNFHFAVNTIQFPELYSKAALLNYIHNQDGKK